MTTCVRLIIIPQHLALGKVESGRLKVVAAVLKYCVFSSAHYGVLCGLLSII